MMPINVKLRSKTNNISSINLMGEISDAFIIIIIL